ncbi:MAG: 4Fe-4S binding protein [Tepidanaerobacteraceae bacterium]|jgi:Fe-S-cluster-containing hydrogenase component 2|nr:4Fe-4S binding protein [Tepidanaerobacteraceae bacterium]
MKIVKTKPELCNGCGACMMECSKLFHKVADPEKSAIRIREKAGKPGSYEIYVCNHCGECISVCNTGALYRAKNGAVWIDGGKCVGCYICVGFCPNNAIFVNAQINQPIKCIACGACTRVCPTGAIYMEEK